MAVAVARFARYPLITARRRVAGKRQHIGLGAAGLPVVRKVGVETDKRIGPPDGGGCRALIQTQEGVVPACITHDEPRLLEELSYPQCQIKHQILLLDGRPRRDGSAILAAMTRIEHHAQRVCRCRRRTQQR